MGNSQVRRSWAESVWYVSGPRSPLSIQKSKHVLPRRLLTDTHGHAHESAGRHGAHGPETSLPPPTNTLANPEKIEVQSDSELGHSHNVLTDSAMAQILGVMILEASPAACEIKRRINASI